MKIENNKAHFSQEEGTIVKINEGFVCLGKNQELKEDGYSINHNKVLDSNGKIILAANFKLEGVPLLVKKDSILYVRDKLYSYTKYENPDITRGKRNALIDGYNAHAATHPYTRADIEKAIELSHAACRRDIPYGIDLKEEILQQLNQPEIPKHLDLEVEDDFGTTFLDSISQAMILNDKKYKLKSDNGIIYY